MKMLKSTVLLGALALSVSVAPAQRTWGYAECGYAIQGEDGSLEQVGPSNTLKWYYSPTTGGFGSVTAQMPFDAPGCIVASPQLPVLFYASGIDSTTGTGYLVTLHLDPLTRTISIDSVQVLGAQDPIRAEINATENRIYYFDRVGLKIYSAALGVSPLVFVQVADTTSAPVLAKPGAGVGLSLIAPPVGDPGIEIAWTLDSAAIFGSSGTWKVELSPTNGQWETIPVPPQPPSGYVERFVLRYPDTVPLEGALQLWGLAGAFSIVRDDTGAAVFSGVLNSSRTWESVQIPPGSFELGKQYRVTAPSSAFADSRAFEPTLRYGSETVVGMTTLGKVLFDPSKLAEVSQHFQVTARMAWGDGSQTPPATAAAVALHVAVWEPGQDPTVNFNGLTVLANPLVVFDPESWPVHPELGIASFVYDIDLAGLGDVPLLFQFFGISPDGELIASDIGGGNVVSAQTLQGASLTANGSTQEQTTNASRLSGWATTVPGANTAMGRAFWDLFVQRAQNR